MRTVLFMLMFGTVAIILLPDVMKLIDCISRMMGTLAGLG